MSKVTATEARATLPEILDRVGDGDEVPTDLPDPGAGPAGREGGDRPEG
jgi:hypothetical protein